MPSIHGIETGMSMDEAESILKKIYESAGNSGDKAIYLNRSNGFGIGLQAENGNVSQLIVGQLSETDLQEYLHFRSEVSLWKNNRFCFILDQFGSTVRWQLCRL